METANRPKIATLFGGAGFIGRAVVARLARQGWIVRVASRDAEPVRALATQGFVGQIVHVTADVTDAASAARAVAGASLVVNLVGILFERRRGDFDRIQADGARIVAAAAAAASADRLVHLSAIGADRSSDSGYARTKGEGEAAVRAAFPAATILRPSLVFGPDDQFFNRFAAIARLSPVMPVISGNSRFQPVYVGDVADAVLAAATREDAPGRTYELGGPRVATFRELLAFILQATDCRRPLVDIPASVASLQARVGELLPNPPLTRDQLKLLSRDNVADASLPGLVALGIAPKAIEAIVPQYLARFRPPGRS